MGCNIFKLPARHGIFISEILVFLSRDRLAIGAGQIFYFAKSGTYLVWLPEQRINVSIGKIIFSNLISSSA